MTINKDGSVVLSFDEVQRTKSALYWAYQMASITNNTDYLEAHLPTIREFGHGFAEAVSRIKDGK